MQTTERRGASHTPRGGVADMLCVSWGFDAKHGFTNTA